MSDAVIGIHQKESDVTNEGLSAASLSAASLYGYMRQLLSPEPDSLYTCDCYEYQSVSLTEILYFGGIDYLIAKNNLLSHSY